MNDKDKTLLIKRYSSRRLYNSETSDYVTLQEISELIRSGRDVQIVDLKTGEDLTRQYLIRIISDHEARGEQVLPINVLTEVVRNYSDQANNLVPQFLDASFEMFKEGQAKILENLKAVSDPLGAYEELERNQREFIRNAMNGWQGKSPTRNVRKPHDPERPVEEEVEELKRIVAELQQKVSSM